MSAEEQKEKVKKYFGDYKPIVDIFCDLITACNVDVYESYDDFKAAIESNKEEGVDTTLFGFLPEDSANNRQTALYLYLPNICIGWIPLTVIEDLIP